MIEPQQPAPVPNPQMTCMLGDDSTSPSHHLRMFSNVSLTTASQKKPMLHTAFHVKFDGS